MNSNSNKHFWWNAHCPLHTSIRICSCNHSSPEFAPTLLHDLSQVLITLSVPRFFFHKMGNHTTFLTMLTSDMSLSPLIFTSKKLLNPKDIGLTSPITPKVIAFLCEYFQMNLWLFKEAGLATGGLALRSFAPQHLQISDAFREVFCSWKLCKRSYLFYLV